MTTIVVTRLTKPQANYRDNTLINPQFIISSSFYRTANESNADEQIRVVRRV